MRNEYWHLIKKYKKDHTWRMSKDERKIIEEPLQTVNKQSIKRSQLYQTLAQQHLPYLMEQPVLKLFPIFLLISKLETLNWKMMTSDDYLSIVTEWMCPQYVSVHLKLNSNIHIRPTPIGSWNVVLIEKWTEEDRLVNMHA